MHRILLIDHHASIPQHNTGCRSFHFAREWVRSGHRVLIIAASFSHIRQRNPDVRSMLRRETIDGVDFLWIRAPRYRGNGAGRVVNMLVFIVQLYLSCQKSIVEFCPDLVIASSVYTWDNWPAAFYAKRCDAQYVYELHDVWPLTLIELAKMSPRNPFIWTLQKAEDFACRRADKVISLLPATRAHLMGRGMPSQHFAYIPNGIVKEEWLNKQEVPLETRRAIAVLRQRKKYLVGYMGGHGLSNALDVLVKAGADARMKDVAIVCIGNGPEKNRLQKKAGFLGSDVLFLDPVPRLSVPSTLKLFDVLFIGWNKSPLYRFGISPNKLFEYMMSGVPIIHAVDAANDPVRDAGCGLSVPPEDASALCDGILKLVGLSQQEGHIMGERGRQYVQGHHMVDNLARKFLDVVFGDN